MLCTFNNKSIPDPAVYPFFEIYPGNVVAPQEIDGPSSVKLASVYPALDICEWHIFELMSVLFTRAIDPAVYPVFEIYPGNVIDVQTENVMTPLSVRLQARYPVFDICTCLVFHFSGCRY